MSVLRKCRAMASGVWIPSTRPGEAFEDGWTSVPWIESISEVMTPTSEFTNRTVTVSTPCSK